MARWYRRYRRYGGYSRRGRHWSPTTQVVSATTGSSQASLPIAYNRVNTSSGINQYPIGPIMKVKNFRLNVVFDSSVTVLWALVYVPEGMPIGRLNSGPATPTDNAFSLYEPQQYIIASGLYSSQGTDGSTAGPLRVWTPLARNLNPGDGVFFVWKALTTASGIGTFLTVNYACCVN